jgi:hypothetical protein
MLIRMISFIFKCGRSRSGAYNSRLTGALS